MHGGTGLKFAVSIAEHGIGADLDALDALWQQVKRDEREELK